MASVAARASCSSVAPSCWVHLTGSGSFRSACGFEFCSGAVEDAEDASIIQAWYLADLEEGEKQ